MPYGKWQLSKTKAIKHPEAISKILLE